MKKQYEVSVELTGFYVTVEANTPEEAVSIAEQEIFNGEHERAIRDTELIIGEDVIDLNSNQQNNGD